MIATRHEHTIMLKPANFEFLKKFRRIGPNKNLISFCRFGKISKWIDESVNSDGALTSDGRAIAIEHNLIAQYYSDLICEISND